MSNKCKFCGRTISGQREVCDICEYTLCRKCGNRLAKGYCAICGKLVCEHDSEMVGFARVCKECLSKDPNLRDYDYLKNKVLKHSLLNLRRPVVLKKILSVNGGLELGEKYFVFIGLDDADSPFGMCTTYLAGKIIEKLSSIVEFLDYPYLVRLNPNIPFKTRGNASVSIRVSVDSDKIDSVVNIVKETFSSYVHSFFKKTSGILAIYTTNSNSNKIESVFKEIYEQAVKDVLTPSIVKQKLKKIKQGELEIYSATGKENGLIGATAALGAKFDLYTFELLAYRKPENIGKPREIDFQSVVKMDRLYRDWTFNNVDGNRILITPTGPDPVLYGIRGYDPRKLLEAKNLIKSEEADFWVIYKTNQGTNAHIITIKDLAEARPYQTVKFTAIFEEARKEDSKNVIFARSNEWKLKINVYKPQSNLREIAHKLIKGDTIEVIANVQQREKLSLELNIEEIHLLDLVPKTNKKNPLCPVCGSRLKSKGKNTYKCKKCGYSLKTKSKIIIVEERREPKICVRYVPPPKAQRHLTMPQNFSENKIMRYKRIPTPIWGRK